MKKLMYAALSALVFLVTAGCGHYGALEEDYGKSYNLAKDGQILNPGAQKNLKPVTGLNGNAADAALKKYTDSFRGKEQPAQQQGFTLIAPSTTGADGYGK